MCFVWVAVHIDRFSYIVFLMETCLFPTCNEALSLERVFEQMIKILRKVKARVTVKRSQNRECSRVSVNQIQLRGFRTRALGTLFHKMKMI